MSSDSVDFVVDTPTNVGYNFVLVRPLIHLTMSNNAQHSSQQFSDLLGEMLLWFGLSLKQKLFLRAKVMPYNLKFV